MKPLETAFSEGLAIQILGNDGHESGYILSTES